MAWTQAQLDALNNAIAMGVKKVKYGDKETEYQSLSEMLDLANTIQLSLTGTGTIASRRKQGIFKSTTNHGGDQSW